MGSNGELLWVGILLGIFASMTGTVGKQMLRFSAVLDGRKLKYNAKVVLTCGLLLNALVGPIVDMASYAFAPQSLIAPLAGLDVVWNTIIAPCTLGEKLTAPVVFGVALIAVGATGTSFFGKHDDPEYTVPMIKDKIYRWPVLIYCILLILWLAFNICFLQKRTLRPQDAHDGLRSERSSETVSPDAPKYVKGDLRDTIRGLSLGMTAGCIAGNMFCVKAFIELVQASIRDEDSSIWADYLPYAVFVGAIVFAVANLYFLTKATREYEALFMGAVFEGTTIVTNAISGIVVYSDLDTLEWHRRILYLVTLGGILSGVLIVAFNSSSETEKEIEKQKKKIAETLSNETGHAVTTVDNAEAPNIHRRNRRSRSAKIVLTISLEDGMSHAYEPDRFSQSPAVPPLTESKQQFEDHMDIEEPTAVTCSKQQGEQVMTRGVAKPGVDEQETTHQI